MTSIDIQNLSKSYGTTQAVQNLSLQVEKGELFGLIGPDGAGKTTVFRMLTTLLLPDEGTATIEGWDIVRDYKQIRNCVGYMPGRFSLYQDLTVQENLQFFATVFGTTIEQNYPLIKDIYEQIKPFCNRRAGKLSGGMKQKLALCCALIHKPKVLFLDEPTTGVDVVSRKEFWQMLAKLKEQGISILVSTPYMDEASLCDRIALMQAGKILSTSTPAQIIADYPTTLYAVKAPDLYALLQHLRQKPEIDSCYPFGEYLHLTLKEDTNITLFQQQLKTTFPHLDWQPITPTIEDSFIRLMEEKGNI
ncbi:ABC transporter ATP-binding protein [uncultured Capnocytophaga sp.]|uniref:ABC transporter ATP-binding protein n=1 Tax=uncultured Capnocytophaga sp. TaxID=159273 RepID=UPI002598E53D|nr:ABC transporter ATP-binding protein [uncultured Capnocytophaga sp.]